MITIEDRVQIEDLHSRFIHAADRRDYPLLRSLYCDEAIDDHGLYHGPVDGYIDWLRVVQDDFVINRHFDRYRRIGTQWYFQHRSLCIDWVQSFPPGDDSLDLVRANPIGTMGPADIVYERVPNLIRALRETAPQTR
jgi:hypothetical protein